MQVAAKEPRLRIFQQSHSSPALADANLCGKKETPPIADAIKLDIKWRTTSQSIEESPPVSGPRAMSV